MYEANRGAIDSAENPLSSSNSKYIDVPHHILREMPSSGDISVRYVQADDQHADILTTALDALEYPS